MTWSFLLLHPVSPLTWNIYTKSRSLHETECKHYLARIPNMDVITQLIYIPNAFDLEPVLIQPAYLQCRCSTDLRRLLIGVANLKAKYF